MRVVIIYKDKTDYSRTVTEFLRDFEKQTSRKLETLDPDTEEGMHFCETYGVVEYPAIVALSDDSILQDMWCGLPLPTISEISYYA